MQSESTSFIEKITPKYVGSSFSASWYMSKDRSAAFGTFSSTAIYQQARRSAFIAAARSFKEHVHKRRFDILRLSRPARDSDLREMVRRYLGEGFYHVMLYLFGLKMVLDRIMYIMDETRMTSYQRSCFSIALQHAKRESTRSQEVHTMNEGFLILPSTSPPRTR